MATYKLTVGDVADIQLNIDETTAKIDSGEYYVTMESLTYSKKIFAPSEIHTVLSVKASKNIYATTPPSITGLITTFGRKLVKLTYDDKTVAENFFVYKIKPSHNRIALGTNMVRVELFIYSMDKLLTVDKCCNAYTAKKLGGEIFTNGITNYWLSPTNMIRGEVNLQMLNYTSKVEKETVDGQEQYKTVEIRQPYLVQYNETFYDFLARSASRCGEMLYFEGGNLHLGMNPNMSDTTTDQAYIAENVCYENCVERVIGVKNRHYNFMDRTEKDDNCYADSSFELIGAFKDEDPVDTKGTKEKGEVTLTYVQNYERGKMTATVTTSYYTSDTGNEKDLKGQPFKKVSIAEVTNDKGQSLWMATETEDYTYKKDDNGQYKKDGDNYDFDTNVTKKIEGQQEGGIYNMSEANDALFKELKKDDYTSVDDEWGDWRQFLFKDLFLRLMNSTNLFDLIADFGIEFSMSWVHASVEWSKKNQDNNKTNLTLTSSKEKDQTDDTNFSLFSTLQSVIDDSDLLANKTGKQVSLLVSDFYSKMRDASIRVSKLLVKLNYGNNNPGLCLGDVIRVDGDFYIVTKVEYDENSNYSVEAIPPFYKETETDASTGDIALKSFIPCPPVMPEIPLIRTSDPQVAFVENNLDPNKLGRVRVRYPWQTTSGDNSPWVRMATPFATNGGGVNFKPEKGDEVLLNYEDGNIERPYIVGSLQSKYVTDHWGALDGRVIQSKNGHTIKFNDNDDALDLLAGAIPALSFVKGLVPNVDPAIGFQDLADMTGGINIKDRYGLYEIDLSSDGRAVTINSPLGNIDLNAFTGITVSAPNGNIEIKGKNVSISASNKLLLESGSAVSDRWLFEKDKSLKERATSAVTDVFDKTVGKLLDLTFIRTIIEVFTRPVDGTLKIRSNTYLLIEAGQGSAQVPRDALRKPDSGLNSGLTLSSSDDSLLGKLTEAIDALTNNAKVICDDIKQAYSEVASVAKEYKNFRIGNVVVYDKLSSMKLDDNDNIVKKVFDNLANFNVNTLFEEKDFKFKDIDEFKLKVVDEEDRTKYQKGKEEPELDENRPEESLAEWSDWNDLKNKDKNVLIPERGKFVDLARNLCEKLKALFDATAKWSTFDFTMKQQTDAYYSPSLMTKVKGKDIFTDFISKANNGTVNLTADFDNGYEKELTKLKRDLVYELLSETSTVANYKDLFVFDKSKKPNDLSDDGSWKDFALTIEAPAEPVVGIGGSLLNYLKNEGYKWKETLSSFSNPLDNKQKWTAPEKGRILLSDMPGRTIHFDSDQLVTDHNCGEATTAHPIALLRKVNSVK